MHICHGGGGYQSSAAHKILYNPRTFEKLQSTNLIYLRAQWLLNNSLISIEKFKLQKAVAAVHCGSIVYKTEN